MVSPSSPLATMKNSGCMLASNYTVAYYLSDD